MKIRSFLAALFLAALSVPAYSAVDPITTSYTVTNVAAFHSMNLQSKQSITLDGFYASKDGGGGHFRLRFTSCTEDYFRCMHDGATPANYYDRTDWDGSLAAAGVTNGSAYDWNTNGVSSADVTPVLTAAGLAAASLGVPEIHTGGVSVYMATSYVQPATLSFSCDQTVGVPALAKWFDTVPGAVFKAHGANWNRAGRISSVHNCYILPSLLATGEPTSAQTLRTLTDAVVSNGDTGLFCDARGCNDHDLFIAGFDTDYDAGQAGESTFENNYLDGDVCAWMHGTGATPHWGANTCFPYLTQDSPGKEEDFTITKVSDDGTGQCKITVTPQAGATLADLVYPKYIYITHLAGAAAVCENQFGGLWQMSNINTGAGTFSLTGSVVAGPSTYGHWASGTNIIYVTDASNITNGEPLTGYDAQGIVSGTTVASVIPLPTQTAGYVTDTGGAANTYVAIASSSVQPCMLYDGLQVPFTPIHTNTAASTLNITLNAAVGCTNAATGPIAIVRQDGSALGARDLIASSHANVSYNATLTKWVIMQPVVILSAATTTAQSVPFAIHFAGGTCDNSGSPVCGNSATALFTFGARVDAGASPGGVAAGGGQFATCMLVGGPIAKGLPDTDKVAGFQEDQGQCFDHTLEIHVQNSNETGFTNFGADSHGNEDNPNPRIVLVDGDSNNFHLTGRKAGKGGVSIETNITAQNSADRGCVTYGDAAVAATTGFLPISVTYAGCLLMTAAVTNSGGIHFVSNFANKAGFSNVYQPNVIVYDEGVAAQNVTCTTGSTLEGGQTCSAQIALPGATLQVATVAALQAGNFGGATAINLGGYYALGDKGGGLLNLDNTCTVDNGNCFQTITGTGDKYKRAVPKWDILEWGGIPDWSTDVSTSLTAMLAAAVTAHQPQVYMGSNSTGSGYRVTSLLTVPVGVNLDCVAAPYTQPASDDFRNFPNALLLVASGGMKFSGSGASNCTALKSNIALAVPPTDIQGAYARYAAFTGNGFQCIADGCEFANDNLIGFDTGITYSGSIRNYNVHNVRVDASTCFAIKQGQENRQQVMDGTICQALATTTATTGTVPPSVRLDLTSVANNGSGEIRANFASCATSNCPQDGMLAWAVNGSSDQSIQGGWVLHNTTTTHTDFTSSDSSFIAGKTVSMTTVSGSRFVIAAAALSSQVKATQTITGTGIPASTTIVYVEKAYNLIVLSAAATASGTNNMTITDAASGHFTITTAVVAAGGSGYVVGDALTADLNGGTLGTGPAILTVATVDGSGGVLTVTITDGGDYTVIPTSPDTVTGGTGSGATFTLSDNTTGQLLLTANSRTGPCYSFFQTNDVVMTNGHCYAHAVGALFQNNASRVKMDQIVFDDAGVLQDDSRICIHFTGNASKNQIANFRCDNYFGHGIVDDTSHSSPSTGNSVNHGLINANSNAGFNQSLIEVLGPASGTAKKSGFVFSDISSGSKGGSFIADDVYFVTSSANLMNLSTVYAQSVTAINKWLKGLSDIYSAVVSYGTLPAVTGTGSPAISSTSNDTSGKVTGGTSATSIIITFAAAKTTAPFCTVSPQTSVASFAYTTSTTAITITQTATTGQIVNYHCDPA